MRILLFNTHNTTIFFEKHDEFCFCGKVASMAIGCYVQNMAATDGLAQVAGNEIPCAITVGNK